MKNKNFSSQKASNLSNTSKQSVQKKSNKDTAVDEKQSINKRNKRDDTFDRPKIKLDKTRLIQILVCSFIILFVGFLVFSKSSTYGLVHCDDNIFVLDYQEFNKDMSNISDAFNKSIGTSYYRPLLAVSFIVDANIGNTIKNSSSPQTAITTKPKETSVLINMLSYIYNSFINVSFLLHNPDTNQQTGVDAQNTVKLNEITGGADPKVFHVTNVLIHLISSLLVFFFIIRMGYPLYTSFLFSMLFILHPILTPAASWISGRNDSLITLFVLLSFISLISFLDIKKRRYETKDYIYMGILCFLHIWFFAMTLFTKEVGIFFPLICLCYILMFRREKLFQNKNYLLGIGYSIVVFIWFKMRADATKGIDNPDTIGMDAFFKNYPTIPALVGKIFLPVKMIALSSFEWFSIITGLIFIAAIIIAIIKLKKLNKMNAMFGLTWFALFLIPTLLVRIVFVDDFFDYAEHRAYLLIIGLMIVVLEILKVFNVDFKKPVNMAIGIALILIFTVRSYSYESTFVNRFTFWSHMTDMYPYKSRGYYDLGKAYFVTNQFNQADSLYRLGIERNPNNKNLYIDLSALYIQMHRYEESYQIALKAYQIDPNDALSNYNVGKALMILNRVSEALPYLEGAANRNNKYPQWFIELGVVYYRVGNYQKSILAYQQALNMEPTNYFAMTNLGTSYAAVSQWQQAETFWSRAINLNPTFPDPYSNLIKYYINAHAFDKAQHYIDLMKKNIGSLPPELVQVVSQFGLKV